MLDSGEDKDGRLEEGAGRSFVMPNRVEAQSLSKLHVGSQHTVGRMWALR